MQSKLKLWEANQVGLALSGGSVRGLAHIGVIKVLNELEIKPVVVAGTSVGSIMGAAVAAGREWHEIADLARSIFWPSLYHGKLCLVVTPPGITRGCKIKGWRIYLCIAGSGVPAIGC